jgi:hypothetical protein
VKQDPGLWKLSLPETPPPQETAGLNKDEADFVSKYLALADELLKSSPAETAAAEQKPAEKSAASTKAA